MIMFQKIPPKLKEGALKLNSSGIKANVAAAAYNISERSLWRAKAKLHDYGDVEGGQKRHGPSPFISPTLGDVASVSKLSDIAGNSHHCSGQQRQVACRPLRKNL